MTIKQLKEIISNLPESTVLLIDGSDEINDVETVHVQYHADGRIHLIFSSQE